MMLVSLRFPQVDTIQRGTGEAIREKTNKRSLNHFLSAPLREISFILFHRIVDAVARDKLATEFREGSVQDR